MKDLAAAYEMIDEMAKALRAFVELHLEKVPDADFEMLIMLDDQGGGVTVSHTYASEDGEPDLASALLGLALAWSNLQKNSGGANLNLGLEEIMEESRRA